MVRQRGKTENTIRAGRTLLILGIVLILAAGGFLLHDYLKTRAGASRAEDVVRTMQQLVPQYDEDDPAATGRGEDPLPVLEVDGTGFVGTLKIPSLSMEIPVAAEEPQKADFAFRRSGSPVKGRFCVEGRDRKGSLASLKDLSPGASITFVDVNGVRYRYLVTGAGSVSTLRGLDHDLILCFPLGSDRWYAAFATQQ